MNQNIMFQRTLIDPDSNIGFFSLKGDHVIIHGFDDFIGCKFGIDTSLGVFSFVRDNNCEDDTSDEFTEEEKDYIWNESWKVVEDHLSNLSFGGNSYDK